MRNVFALAALLLTGMASLAAQENTPNIQPSIMVIPFARENQQLRTVLESDPALRVAVTKVKEGFDNRGYSTIDFRSKLDQLSNDQVMEMDNNTSVKQEVIELAGADIYVEVEVSPNRSSSGNSTTVIMTAYDAFSSRSLANKVCSSPKFYTDDFVKLTERALGETIEEFLNTMQMKFDDIIRNGRTLSMNITFSPSSALDMDAELGANADLFSDLIEDWLAENAYQSYFHVQGVTSTKMIVDDIRVPLKDESGRNFRPSRFVNNFRKFLSAQGIESNRDIQGSKIFITIL